MSIKGGKLKRCRGVSETAACTNGHPFVPIGPESQQENFQPAVMLAIRNFATAFPAGHTDKHIAYHGGQGQAPEEQWRKIRDEYMESSLQTRRDMIQWWKQADYYHIALYLPFEWLLSPNKGPILVQQLADVYQQAGFEVASTPQDISCIWYQVAHKEWQRQEQLQEYQPGYTVEQKEYILKQYQAFLQESKDDPILTQILVEYMQDVEKNTKIDRPSSKTKNETTTSV